MRFTGVYLFVYLKEVKGEKNFFTKIFEGSLPGVLFRQRLTQLSQYIKSKEVTLATNLFW